MAAAAKRGRKAGGSTVDKNETKAQKFERLAMARMSKTLKAVAQLGQLAGSGYESTDAQVEKMFKALSDAAMASYQKFKNKGTKSQAEGFKF